MTPYQERHYRKTIHAKGLVDFQLTVGETDLLICAETDLTKEARDRVFMVRQQLKTYIECHRDFLTTLRPLDNDPFAPPIVKRMIRASQRVNVGPMAAVAGAIAQDVAIELLNYSKQIIVENGGDIFMATGRPVTVSIFAGESPLSEKLGLCIPTRLMPIGVCSSSATVGHSLSRGNTDAVCILSPSAALADAAATALGNRILEPADIQAGARWAQKIDGVTGGVVIMKDHLASWGDIELVEI